MVSAAFTLGLQTSPVKMNCHPHRQTSVPSDFLGIRNILSSAQKRMIFPLLGMFRTDKTHNGLISKPALDCAISSFPSCAELALCLCFKMKNHVTAKAGCTDL